MGKVSKKLTIVVLPPCDKWPEIEVLEKQGHIVIHVEQVYLENGAGLRTTILEADLIFGPNCWLMDETHRHYLNLALKSARLKRYGPASARKKKGVKSNEDDDFDNLGSGDISTE